MDSFTSESHRVLRSFSRKQHIHCLLDIFMGEGAAISETHQIVGLRRNAFKNVVDHGVHDVHGVR